MIFWLKYLSVSFCCLYVESAFKLWISVCVRVFVCVSVYLYLCVCKSQNLKGGYKEDREILRVDREGNGISMRRKRTAALIGGEREWVRQGRGGVWVKEQAWRLDGETCSFVWTFKSSFKILLSSLTISGKLANESGRWETSFHNPDLKSRQVTPLQRDLTQSRQQSPMDGKYRLMERRSQECSLCGSLNDCWCLSNRMEQVWKRKWRVRAEHAHLELRMTSCYWCALLS